MARRNRLQRLSGVTFAVSNTGPLVSAFQSDSFSLLTKVFGAIYIPSACADELGKHGWDEDLAMASQKLVIVKLTRNETRRARTFARQIARHLDSNDPIPTNHLGEAEAIVLALRDEFRHDVLLLDELIARTIAKQAGARVSGFPGVLLLAAQAKLITAEELKARLEMCRDKGTSYARPFIQQVYEMAKESRGKK